MPKTKPTKRMLIVECFMAILVWSHKSAAGEPNPRHAYHGDLRGLCYN